MRSVFSILFCVCATAGAVSQNLQSSYSVNNNEADILRDREGVYVEEDHVTLLYYNNKDINNTSLIKYENISDLENHTTFNRSLRSVIYAHGWLDSCYSSTNDALTTAFLTHRNVNYLELCWEKYSSLDYIDARNSINSVANYFGKYLSAMASNMSLDLKSLTIVGHSLGAHIAGVASKNLNNRVGTIVGLDPAGPAIFEFETDRLTADSAIYVRAIHSDSSFLGINYNVGNADFWPNSGKSQPGCWGIVYGDRCSHLRSIEYYAESIITGNFWGKLCDTYEEYENGKCNVNLEESMGGYPIDSRVVGNFYLDTNSSSPYALGHHDPSKL